MGPLHCLWNLKWFLGRCNILEYNSICSEWDPKFTQSRTAVSSGLIWHLCKELLAFTSSICCELTMSFVHFQLFYWIRSYSRWFVPSSLPPCHRWFYRYLWYSSLAVSFSRWKSWRLLKHSLYHSFSVFISFFQYILLDLKIRAWRKILKM